MTCKINIFGNSLQLIFKIGLIKPCSVPTTCFNTTFIAYCVSLQKGKLMSLLIRVYLTHFSSYLHVFMPQFHHLISPCSLIKFGMPGMPQKSSIKISKTINFALLSLWRSNQCWNHLNFSLRNVKHTCLTYM